MCDEDMKIIVREDESMPTDAEIMAQYAAMQAQQ